VRLGLESLKNHYDALLIALCDQPNIDAPELSELLWQFSDRAAGQEIVLPIFDGQRGNPVVFSKMVIETILAIPGMVCRPYMDQHPELVKQFTSNTQAYVLDVDTEEDIQKLGLDRIKRD
jgi:molybdenum cofactor cytidylyltransferase/nicotine blue oxidoreductase